MKRNPIENTIRGSSAFRVRVKSGVLSLGRVALSIEKGLNCYGRHESKADKGTQNPGAQFAGCLQDHAADPVPHVVPMICVYCGEPATTKDHVPPRCLLEKPYPTNLRTVPCCSRCNSKFSLDEQYFLILLSQIGASPTLAAKVESGGAIDRALSRRPAWHICAALQKVSGLGGRFTGSGISLQHKRPRPLPFFIGTFTARFRTKQWQHVQRGVFSYIIVRDPMHSSTLWCIMDFHETLWGVAHLPNPRSVQARQNRQLWLLGG